jgi:hypothetical protein
MRLKTVLLNALRRVDRLSPHPRFYPFAMSRPEVAMFDAAVKEARTYLEFGSGGSTLRALQQSKAAIYTVDSSPKWIDHLRRYVVVRRLENVRLHLCPIDIGPIGDWGFPTSDLHADRFEAYSDAVFRRIEGRAVDLALVDGRFRVACALRTIQACRKNRGFRMLIHDFWDRPQYHAVLAHLDPVGRADTMGLFAVKEDVDDVALARDYERYKRIPD